MGRFGGRGRGLQLPKPEKEEEEKPKEKILFASETLKQAINENLELLIEVVKTEFEEAGSNVTTFGQESKNLGVRSLSIINLFHAFLAIEEPDVTLAVAKTEFLKLAMVRFFLVIFF